jgi:wyosine [tRNA(Phe)-imidazoG37] synthetase (radical SAM superfamily)
MSKKILRKIIEPEFGIPFLQKTISDIKRCSLVKFPRIVQVETTNVCNAECVMCPHSFLKRAATNMDFGLFKKIVDECAGHQRQMEYFYPFLNGELFLTPHWQEYLSYARVKLAHTKIGIFTNGSLLDEKNITLLLEIQPDWINISFEGTSKEAYENIRRKLNFNQVEDNIIKLINKRKQLHKKLPRVTISIIRMQDNEKDLKGFVSKWKKIVDKVTVHGYSNWAGAITDKTIQIKTLARKPCYRLWTNLVVLANGDACLCCLDYEGKVLLGNLSQEAIVQVWQGARIEEIRSLHMLGQYNKIELCGNCNFGKYERQHPLWWG